MTTRTLLAAAAAASASLTLAAIPSAELPQWARGGKMWADMQAREKAISGGRVGNSTGEFYTQLIDHANPAAGTYRQRYFYDTTYWDHASGPVFVYIGGEGTLGGTPTGYVVTIAQQEKALIVGLEHRWYGASIPGDITSSQDLETLTVEQAIADLAAFIPWFDAQLTTQRVASPSLAGPANAAGLTHVWLAIGGSYPGALSAWFRETHPELVAASWSSSGVVNAVYNFTEFDAIVATALGTECADAVRAVTAAFEVAWDDPNQKPRLLSLFNTPDYFTKADMAWMLADSAAMGSQYGYKLELCSYLVPKPADYLAAFADWTKTHYGAGFGSQCYYSTVCLTDASKYADQWPNVRTWIWQCCKEVAYWQVAYENSLRSSAITLDYFNNQCATAFGIPGMVPDVAGFNKRYNGLTPNSTNVFACNGSDDPWQGAAINATLRSDYLEFTAHCDGCGHCRDLQRGSGNDPASITEQRAALNGNITAWLKAALYAPPSLSAAA